METYLSSPVGIEFFTFKSYYVVWKLVDPPIEEENDDRLNRTM